MPWCPKCEEEYREGFRNCGVCGSTLVEHMPREPETPEVDAGEPVLLTWSNNNMTLQMMDSALHDAGIPFFYKELGPGGTARNYLAVGRDGAEIYVPEKLLGRARDVIAVFEEGQAQTHDRPASLGAATDEDTVKRKRRRSILIGCIFIFIVVPAAILVILWKTGML